MHLGQRAHLLRATLVAGAVCAVLSGAGRGSWTLAVPVTRRVLVTGGNKGIGYALCKQLAADHGCHVLLGSRDADRGKRAIENMLKREPKCEGKVELLPLDVAEDASVASAAEQVRAVYGDSPAPLYGIVNNAGLGFSHSMAATLGVNILGVKRVCDAFLPLLGAGGRIVNTASASGPMFVARCSERQRQVLTNPEVNWDEIAGLMQEALSKPDGMEPYGFSKACVNAYTMFLARRHPNLVINSMTPGFIDTDITAGMGATKPPEEGTKAAFHCMFGDLEGSGRYYGSDAVRSPLDRYRGPGDPPYEGP